MHETVRALLEDEGFDRVLIDSPAGIETGFQTAAAAAQGALVVVNPEVSSVRDADRIIGLLEAREITEVRLIINRLRPKMVKRGDMLEVSDVLDILGVKLIGIVPEDERVLISTNVGSPAALEDGGAKTTAGSAFRDIARRIGGEDVAYPDLDGSKGVFSGLRRLFGAADVFNFFRRRRSKDDLKQRLKLVLSYDRARLSPARWSSSSASCSGWSRSTSPPTATTSTSASSSTAIAWC